MTCSAENTTLPTLNVTANHWRPGFHSIVARPCPNAHTCSHGMVPDAAYNRFSNATCQPGKGLAGAYCMLCMDPTHYFDSAEQRCRPCDAAREAITIGVLASAVVVAGVAVYLIKTRAHSMPTLLCGCWSWCAVVLARVSFRPKLRIAISFFQIATQIDRVYALRFSPAFSSFMRALSVVNVGLEGLPALPDSRCAFGPAFRALSARLLGVALVPIGLAILPFVVKIWRPDHAALPQTLLFIFFVLPSITSSGFRALAPCECFDYVGGDGGQVCFLREDYEVECTSEGPMSASSDVLAAAWTAIGIWAIAMPLALLALIWMGVLKDDGLTDDYRPDRRWWEAVVVVEKLTLTGFMALYNPGSWQQLFVATIVALFSFVLQVLVQPYRTRSDNMFAQMAAFSLVPLFIGSLGRQFDAKLENLGYADGDDSYLVLLVLFGFTLSVLFALSAFFAWELTRAREVLVLQSTGQLPELAPPPPKWHLFLSHNWDNQDAVATIKRQLQRLLPGVRIFLDVDDLESVDALEAYVHDSAVVLILLGSVRYFKSTNCLREVSAAKENGRPLVLVHEADAQKNGSPLEVLKAACPDEHRAFVFDGEAIPWHRVRDFQLMSLAKIAERLPAAPPRTLDPFGLTPDVLSGELRVVGGLAWAELLFESPVDVYASPHNPLAATAVGKLAERFPGMVLGVKDASAAKACFLFLSADCFEGDRGSQLAAEVKANLERGGVGPALLMVYDPMANPFGDIIDHTFKHAPALMELGLFDALAIEWRSGALGEVSVRMVAQRLGARRWAPSQLCRYRAVRPHTSLGWLRPRLRNGRLIERAVSLRGETDAPSDGLAMADVEEAERL